MKQTYLEKRAAGIPKGATKIQDKQSSAVAYIYADSKGRPCAHGYSGRRWKPSFRFWFRKEADREKRITEFFTNIRIVEKRDKKAKEPHALQEGQILVCSWGYDQTNVDFYQVVGFKGKATVALRPIKKTKSYDGDMTGKATPHPNEFTGEALERRCYADHAIKISSFQYARPWDGKPAGFTEYA